MKRTFLFLLCWSLVNLSIGIQPSLIHATQQKMNQPEIVQPQPTPVRQLSSQEKFNDPLPTNTPTPLYLASMGNPPTATPTNTPTPTVVCTKKTVNGSKAGSGYFPCEGIGLRAANTTYRLEYYDCSDGFFEFRTDNQASGSVVLAGELNIIGWGEQLTLVTGGTGLSWFGPVGIPTCNELVILPLGAFDVCGFPNGDSYGVKPSNAFFDSISFTIYILGSGSCPGVSISLDKTLSL